MTNMVTNARHSLRLLAVLITMAVVGSALSQPAVAQEPVPDKYIEIAYDGTPTSAIAASAAIFSRLSLDSGYRPASLAPGAGSPGSCPAGRCYDVRIPVPADIKIKTSESPGDMARVIVPQGYHAAANRNRAYPVVYVYNGARSPYVRWSEATGLVPIANNTEAILVMPEGGMNDDAGMFSDWEDGTYQWETFHTEVLPKFIDRNFRTAKNARVLVGASMGGLGALYYGAQGFAQSVLSLSGSVDTNDMVLNALPSVLSPLGEALGASKPNLLPVWGLPLGRTWNAHNPTMLAQKYKANNVALFIATGTGYLDQSSETGMLVHSPYTERLLWNGHMKFFSALHVAGAPYEARIRQGGGHYWSYFDEPLKWGLPKAVQAAIERAKKLELANPASIKSPITDVEEPSTPSPSNPAPTNPGPSNNFAVATKAKAFPKKGALSVAVRVPGPGTVRVARAQKKFPVRANRVSVPKQGVRRVAIRLTPKGLKQLQNRFVRAQRNGKKVARMPVRVKIRYTPQGGQPRTLTRRYVVRMR